MGSARLEEPHGIVQAAVLVEVGADGNQFEVFGVVANYFYAVASLGGKRADVHREGRVATFVAACEAAVDQHGGGLRGAFEDEVGGLAGLAYVN